MAMFNKDCSECHGTGKIGTTNMDCPHCKQFFESSTGKEPCPHCNGLGCWRCGNTGSKDTLFG